MLVLKLNSIQMYYLLLSNIVKTHKKQNKLV